jgi:protein involved in polysaccharide export with SLBB domain
MIKKTSIKIIGLMILAFTIVFTAQAQIPANLSGYTASMITDDQLKNYIEQAVKAGLSEMQIEEEVRRRGLPESEIIILRSRIKEIISGNATAPKTITNDANRGRKNLPATSSPTGIEPSGPSVFGSQLFSNSAMSFEPDLRMPTPSNYRLGPDDQLIVDVYGINQTQQTKTVTPEGAIALNYVGPIYVNGLTVEEAKNRIVAKLSQVYPAIRSGGTKVQVSLGAIRSIKVTILGSVVKPGTYTLPSLATLFNALYSSGGPDENGSFRSIELIRNNKIVEKVDIYKFLLSGDQSQNVRLQDMDVIRIPIAKTKVEIKGEVVRQGIFELLTGETLETLISEYSGGFHKTAYTAMIRSERITERERKLIDISKSEISGFIPQDGDIYTVDRILERYSNAVSITGAVFRPGRFSFTEGMKISDLIRKADGLKEDVYTQRALLYRLKEDLTKEITAIDIKDVLRNGSNNVELRKDDSLAISTIFELTSEYSLSIAGAVRKPGTVLYRENMTVKDVIMQAGGLTDEASLSNIDIARRRNNVDPNDPNALLSDVLAFSMDTIELSINNQDFKVAPFDIITVKTDPFKKPQEQVVIEGQVLYPGPYAILTRQERLSSIVGRSGFVLAEANTKGAKLKRLKRQEVILEEEIDKMSKQAKDSTGSLVTAVNDQYDFIALDLAAALQNPGGEADIFVQNGDIISIPLKDEMVNIEGEVLHPVKLSYEKGKNLRHYINAAGGFVSSANKNKVFVVYANGKAARTKRFIFFRNYPEVEEGSQIFVPKYIPEEKPKKSAAEVMATVSAVSTMAYLIIYLTNQIK